ncbi:Uncharacterised protein [uncultured archaeon]|nr:Uncharacterised protein [uncultured archaeon]
MFSLYKTHLNYLSTLRGALQSFDDLLTQVKREKEIEEYNKELIKLQKGNKKVYIYDTRL